jgi:hypothetical protein
MNGMCDWELLTSTIHIAPYILEENTPISSSKITDILNTLKLAIFSLYVIYVLRLINILKNEIFFRDQKLAEMFWLYFYMEAMLPPHPCTVCPCLAGYHMASINTKKVVIQECLSWI